MFKLKVLCQCSPFICAIVFWLVDNCMVVRHYFRGVQLLNLFHQTSVQRCVAACSDVPGKAANLSGRSRVWQPSRANAHSSMSRALGQCRLDQRTE